MEAQKSILDSLVEKVPTDISGKWVNTDELRPCAIAVADYVLSRVERNINDSNL